MSNIAKNDRKQLNRFWREESNDCSPNKNHCHKVQHLYCYFKGDNTLAGKQTLNKHACSTQSTVPYTDSFCCCISAKLSAIPLWYRAAFHIYFLFQKWFKIMCILWERNRCISQVLCFVRSRKITCCFVWFVACNAICNCCWKFLHSWCILSHCQRPCSCTIESIWSMLIFQQY